MASWAGLPAAEIHLRLDDGPAQYRGDIDIRTEGLPRLFTRFRGYAVATGLLWRDGAVTPGRYDALYDLRKRHDKRLSFRFARAADGMLVAERGPEDSSSKPQLPEAARRNVVDPITALVAIRHQIRSGALRRSGQIGVPIYDGSRRFDISGIATRSAGGDALQLDLVLQPIAGFHGEGPDEEEPEEAPRRLRLSLTNDDRLLPLRVEVPIAHVTAAIVLDHVCTAASPCSAAFDAMAALPSAGD
jgi:hypothetical protein